MRNLAFVPLTLFCMGAAPPPQAASPAPPAPPAETQPSFDRMNVLREGQDCVPIARQVSGEDRRYDGTRLDQQPPGRLILAVDRQVNGCREVTFANGQQRAAGFRK